MEVLNQESGRGWTLLHGDSCEVLKGLPDQSIHHSVFSPPFSATYVYSPHERDLGNVRSHEEFFEHFHFITQELLRVMLPGRIVAVHCANLPTYQNTHGASGRYDFRGDIIRHFVEHGFIYHSEVCIQKNPQAQAIRNHSKGLLFVQLKRDSAAMWQGWADYICVFRAPGVNPIKVKQQITQEQWIEWAAPVWHGIRETDVLPVLAAKGDDDERHLCPLQLPVIERCLKLWSNPGETVLSPFAGVGSEGYESLLHGRKFVGIELKESYYRVAVRNLMEAEAISQGSDLFSWAEGGVSVPPQEDQRPREGAEEMQGSEAGRTAGAGAAAHRDRVGRDQGAVIVAGASGGSP